MEQEFLDWFEKNKTRFYQSQFDDKQIAYSAWVEGQNKALQQHNVSNLENALDYLKEKGITGQQAKTIAEWMNEFKNFK